MADNTTDCIFCKIIKGDIKTPGIFWENDKFMAFLSIFPNTEGFTIVIPKKHYSSDILKIPSNVLSEFILAAKTVSKILVKHFEDVGRVGLMIEGTGVNHAHIKLFPMHGTKDLENGKWKEHISKNDKFFEIYEGYISSHDGPKVDEEKLKDLADKLRKTELEEVNI